MSYATSLTGLQNAQTNLNVIANNISNADTTGFKQSTVQFANLVATSAYTNPKEVVGIGSAVAQIEQDFSQGSVKTTGSALDLEISGQGFFAVKSPITTQTAYTRNGNFSLDSTNAAATGNSYIVDTNGNRLQVTTSGSSTPGDAIVATTDSTGAAFAGVTVSASGVVSASYSDGGSTPVGTIALASFISPDGLLQNGDQDYTATGLSGQPVYGQPATGTYGTLRSGALEESNVDLSTQLVDLITAQQYFEANSKAIDANTTTVENIINLHQ
ncbi:flagellar hook-basal body protein [Novosphingobium sp.]|uniref:flagellar hook-basal body protein n=1 Tax=Novosphingobium sp. TaxID=1874826 RepID=UPI003D1054AF